MVWLRCRNRIRVWTMTGIPNPMTKLYHVEPSPYPYLSLTMWLSHYGWSEKTKSYLELSWFLGCIVYLRRCLLCLWRCCLSVWCCCGSIICCYCLGWSGKIPITIFFWVRFGIRKDELKANISQDDTHKVTVSSHVCVSVCQSFRGGVAMWSLWTCWDLFTWGPLPPNTHTYNCSNLLTSESERLVLD